MTFRRTPRIRHTDTTTGAPLHVSAPTSTAILVWHGMGQQVPFETIERVARSLIAHDEREHNHKAVTTVRLVELGQEKTWRAEVEMHDASGRSHSVHIYEAHWAPLTQGKITVAETVMFLINAAYQAIRHTLARPAAFQRFLFNRWVTFDLRRPLTAAYVVLLFALLALIVINGAITMTFLVKPFTGLTAADSWPTFSLLRDLTIDFSLLGLTLLVTGGAFFGVFVSQRKNQRRGVPSPPVRLGQFVLWGLAALTVVVILAIGGLVAWHLLLHVFRDEQWWRWSIAWDSVPVLLLSTVVWIWVIVASAVVRHFLLEFVGDSAVYVWSHVLNRFFETRQTIRQQSLAKAVAIYAHGGYERHVLMGHSLGSVIAYDTLNGLLNQDALHGQTLAVRRRTRLLLTFGTILDKTAFLFRTQTGRDDIRDALASATQPLISDAAARPPWINIFSPHDLFGGRLEYYDPGNGTPGPVADGSSGTIARPIENISDPHAWVPLLAHDQYWTSPALVNALVDAITTPWEATEGVKPKA